MRLLVLQNQAGEMVENGSFSTLCHCTVEERPLLVSAEKPWCPAEVPEIPRRGTNAKPPPGRYQDCLSPTSTTNKGQGQVLQY